MSVKTPSEVKLYEATIVFSKLDQAYLLMFHSDKRFNTPGYEPVGELSFSMESKSAMNGKQCRLFVLTNGSEFEVYPDWTVNPLKTTSN